MEYNFIFFIFFLPLTAHELLCKQLLLSYLKYIRMNFIDFVLKCQIYNPKKAQYFGTSNLTRVTRLLTS